MLEKFKEMLGNNKEQDNKKKIENLLFIIVILIITIIAINYIWKDDGNKEKVNNSNNTKTLAQSTITSSENNSEEYELEKKLEKILKNIKGVGNVSVCMNYSETSTIEAMYNENKKESNTEESDTSGGKRTVQETDSQKEIIYTEDNGEKKPITQKVISPKIEGAIITAEGASNSEIKSNIVQAVEAVTGLATHKIQVFEMKKQ